MGSTSMTHFRQTTAIRGSKPGPRRWEGNRLWAATRCEVVYSVCGLFAVETCHAGAGRPAGNVTPWTAGAELLYLRPSIKLDYAILDPTPGQRVPDVGATTLEVDPDYSAGYRLTLGYTLPNTFDVTRRGDRQVRPRLLGRRMSS